MFVFMRIHPRKSLEQPYTGHHKIINQTSDGVYEIHVNGASRQVFMDHLKPSFFMRSDAESLLPIQGDSVIRTALATPLRTFAKK